MPLFQEAESTESVTLQCIQSGWVSLEKEEEIEDLHLEKRDTLYSANSICSYIGMGFTFCG